MAKPEQEEDFMDTLGKLAEEAADESVDEIDIEAEEDVLVEDELDALRAERDEFKDKMLRAMAEAENARKRADRDRREAENYGGSRLVRDLLPVYDNMTRALESVPEDQRDAVAGLLEGVELTLKELVNVLGKHGVRRVTPEIGDRFDPQNHQAMFEAPVPGTTAGDIIQVMAEGFMLHDRLLRPAQVGVSSTPAGG